ncbi:hypothetical protein AB4491_18770, partial [Vibrio sp. 10N.261.45.A7]
MKKIFAYFLLILLLISAIPSFFGEKPALVLNHADSSLPIEPLLSTLIKNQITPLSVENQQDETTLIFENKKEQREAQQVLSLAFPLAHSHFSFVSAAPQLFSQVGLTPINLGLDLRGGVQFMLQVEIDDSVKSLVEATSTNARHVARAEGIRSRIADIDNNGFSVIITNLSSRDSNSIQSVTDHMRSQF